MRVSLRDENTSLKDFKKVYKSYYAGMHESVREKAIIKDYEKATGKKYDPKGTPKKVKRVSKIVAEDQEPGT